MTAETDVQIVLFLVGLALLFGWPVLGRLAQTYGTRFGRVRTLGPAAAAVPIAITRLDVIYAVAMIVGILAKEIWDNINETGRVNVQLARIIGALLASPIVYAAVYSQIAEDELSLLGLAIAFQNGFFWQAVFRTVQEGMPGPQAFGRFRVIG